MSKKEENPIDEKIVDFMLEQATIGMMRYDSKGVITFCNQAVIDILGSSREKLVGLKLLDLPDQEIVDAVKSSLDGKLTHYESEYRSVTGNKKTYLQTTFNPVLSKSKEVLGGIIVTKDITKENRIEQELKVVLERQKLILGSIPDIVMEVDINKVYTWANPAGYEFFGEDVIGKEASFYFENVQDTYEVIKPLFNGRKGIIYVESWQRRKDGEKRLLAWWCQTLYDDAGNPIGALSTARDMTETRRLQIEIQKSRQEYKDLAEFAPIGILRCDAYGNINYVNSQTLKLLGSPSAEETKKINLLAFPPLKMSGFSDRLRKALDSGKKKTKELFYQSKWGKSLWMKVYIKPLFEKDTVIGTQILIDDITERKNLEKEKEKEEKKLRLILQGMPNPAWLITKKRKIIAQNRAAEKRGSKIGQFCWQSIQKGDWLSEKHKKVFEKTGSYPPDAQCFFCQADQALRSKKLIHTEISLQDSVWEEWWIPLKDDLYLHYAIDVTKYKKMEEKLYIQSITDTLTGLYNRRHFIQALGKEMMRFRRSQRDFSLIMLDIDHFKNINDTFGHNAGDEVLKKIGAIIQGRIRSLDIAARWGGEEFLIFMPETNINGGSILAESLREIIAETEIVGVGNVTASFGVAAYHNGDNVDTFVERADKLMYEAKESGRNQVRIESE